MKLLSIMVMALMMIACSENNDNNSGADHFLKEKTGTIDKAKEVEAIMLKAAEDQANIIEEQTQ